MFEKYFLFPLDFLNFLSEFFQLFEQNWNLHFGLLLFISFIIKRAQLAIFMMFDSLVSGLIKLIVLHRDEINI